MPGTPAATPGLSIPRYAGADAADFPTQWNAGVDQLDKAFQRVTTLPASPVDGQTVIYSPPTTGHVTIVGEAPMWWLRYTTTGTTPRWVFVGGGTLQCTGNEPTSTAHNAGTQYHTITTRFVTPYPGVYLVDVRGSFTPPATAQVSAYFGSSLRTTGTDAVLAGTQIAHCFPYIQFATQNGPYSGMARVPTVVSSGLQRSISIYFSPSGGSLNGQWVQADLSVRPEWLLPTAWS
jgi:hypothetical protein